MANYKLSTFLATPTEDDVRLKIYDVNKNLRYSIDPHVSYFFKKANIVVIRVEDRNDIFLDFSTSTESAQALAKLNDAKRSITIPTTCDPVSPDGRTVYSKANLNMSGEITLNDGDLACNTEINDIPISTSHVRVFINGLEVNVGGKVYPYDCYFSPNGGTTVRVVGDERKGDKLYWNTTIAGYNLDSNDLIDFVYLIQIDS